MRQKQTAICQDYDKNKGKNKRSYYLNLQIKKEFAKYLKYLQQTRGNLNQESYLFTSQKQNRPYNRVNISCLFSSVYRKFSIKGAGHLGRYLLVSKLVNSGVNICLVQKLANHKTSQPLKDILIITNTCTQMRLKMQEHDIKLTPSKK